MGLAKSGERNIRIVVDGTTVGAEAVGNNLVRQTLGLSPDFKVL